jgi:hypothetical protein
LKQFIHWGRQGIIFYKKLEAILTMAVLINLRITSYHLVILTNWLLLFFPNKKSSQKITKKLLIFLLFFKIKKSLSMRPKNLGKKKVTREK